MCVCCRQLALTLKSLGTQHLHSVEIYKTYPEPYSVDDARWHWVRGKYNSYTLVLLTEECTARTVCAVVKLFSKRWLVPIGARLEGPKLEPEWPKAELGLPTTNQEFSSI